MRDFWFLLAYLQGYVSTVLFCASPCKIYNDIQLDYSEVFLNRSLNHEATLVMGVVTNLLILISVLSAFPWLRNNFHNVFERHHRFIGWLVYLPLHDNREFHTTIPGSESFLLGSLCVHISPSSL